MFLFIKRGLTGVTKGWSIRQERKVEHLALGSVTEGNRGVGSKTCGLVASPQKGPGVGRGPLRAEADAEGKRDSSAIRRDRVAPGQNGTMAAQ